MTHNYKKSNWYNRVIPLFPLTDASMSLSDIITTAIKSLYEVSECESSLQPN